MTMDSSEPKKPALGGLGAIRRRAVSVSPETLVKVTPASEPEVFHPVVSVSNPGFPTRFCDGEFTVTVRSSLL